MKDEIIPSQPAETGLEVIQNTMEEFLATSDVRVVYGEPILHDDTMIIPTAEILCGFGFGIGSGSGTNAVQNPDKPSQGSGSGGGGGGRILSRPVAGGIGSPEGGGVEP